MAKKVSCNFGKKSVVVVDREGNRTTEITPSVTNIAGGTVNIMVFGEISEWWGVNKHDVYWALKNNPGASQVNVYISSPGGEVDTAFVIHDMLKGHSANVTAYLIGQCASAATVISCAATEVIMSEQCLFMIHKPSWFMWGDADAMRKGADILDKYQALIINVYKKKTGMDDARLNELMNQETWFEPGEALALGFVDSVVDAIELNFEAPASGDNRSDGYYLYDSAEEYRVAAFTALQKGLKPFKGEQKNSPKLSTMFGKDFFTNLLKNLQTSGTVAKDANLDKLATDLAGDEGLVKSLDAAALTDAVEKAVANATTAPQLTIASIMDVVEKSSDEDKEKLAKALNLDPKEDDEVNPTEAKIKALQDEIAALKKGGSSGQAPNNGKASTDGKKPEGEAKKVTKAQRDILVKSFNEGNISAEMFTKLTGEEAPERSR